jgi:hypothetical protein
VFKLDLFPLTYWHEYLDLVLLYKIINNYTYIDESARATMAGSGIIRSEANTNLIKFTIPFAKTVTFQTSYFGYVHTGVVRAFSKTFSSLLSFWHPVHTVQGEIFPIYWISFNFCRKLIVFASVFAWKHKWKRSKTLPCAHEHAKHIKACKKRNILSCDHRDIGLRTFKSKLN